MQKLKKFINYQLMVCRSKKLIFDFNQITQATEDKMVQCAVEDAKRKQRLCETKQ
ncbi:MAG: hypothetical protein IPJ43_14540 [Saprospiraceae bacterium]|nr:hypothetical protein [Saprospiraceae bacterium]